MMKWLKRFLSKDNKKSGLVIEHDVLIADGKPNLNGRSYNIASMSVPDNVALFDSFQEDHKVIGRTQLFVEGSRIHGRSVVFDSNFAAILRGGAKLHVVCQGYGDIENNKVKDYHMTNVALTDDPSDTRLGPIRIVEDLNEKTL